MRPDRRRTPTAIDRIANEYVERIVQNDPEFATTLGIPGQEEKYADHSPAGLSARREILVHTLADLNAAHPVDQVDLVTLDVMKERIGLQIEIIDSGVTPLNNIWSVPQTTRSILDLMPSETYEDWGHIAGRLANVPQALGGYIESLNTSRAAGHTPALRQVEAVIEQCKSYIAEEGYFDSLINRAPTEEPSLVRDLLSGNDAAKNAYRDLMRYLDEDLRHDARQKDAVGRDYYTLMSREFLGAEIDLEETYWWGVAELDRIVAEQKLVAEQIEPGASIERARELLDADPSRRLHGTEALKAWMQEKSDTALRELGKTHFEIPSPMDRLECLIAPTADGVVYYTGPSADFSRPGRMWWSVPKGEESFTTWSETSTIYHEGVPGHHLQIATALLAGDQLNRYRSEAVWVAGQGEGWALYAERLMEELGYLEDPGDRLGMLDGQRLRAARVVFDIGVHLELAVPQQWGSGVWDATKGWEFLKANLSDLEGRIRFEYLRYLGWPGQAPSYKIGQRLWEQIREEVRRRDGDAFDEKAFHTRALRLGSMGLDSLRRALLNS
ncbi:DUF885 domain-containing protein [Arthrobacter sp. 18067]|uniref:DUF885 domain-containing protein n=1 Tax=Arthrobacter sp. 18067 TaxID=2681413 RepID=UPI00135C4286|nr:DUF885 domain-containing protein [Arthrobacter sp. 18067]